MKKILISMPDQLAERTRVTIPSRQRSQATARLIESEVIKREKALYQCALTVEKDSRLKQEMLDWDVTLSDGLSDESW